MIDIKQLLAAVQEGRASLEITSLQERGRATAQITLSGTLYEIRLNARRIEKRQQATMKRYRSKTAWTTEELEKEGLPLYWSRSWLVRQFMDNKSLTAMELLTGYPRETLAIWKRRHNITGNPRHDAIRKEWESGKFPTKAELAATYDISIPTLGRILKKAE